MKAILLTLLLLVAATINAQKKFTVAIQLETLSDSSVFTSYRADTLIGPLYNFVFEQRPLQDMHFAYVLYDNKSLGIVYGGVSKEFLIKLYPSLIDLLKDLSNEP